MDTERGFTLVELTGVMVISAVLAAVAIPRLFDKNAISSRAARDYIAGGLRYSQKSAIAMRRNVCVGISGRSFSATYASAAGADQPCGGANALMHPANGLPYADPANALPGGASVTGPASLLFDATGRPLGAPSVTLASALAISVAGYAQPITIEPETGLIH
jgi:MSHA pilin protein MshC